MKLAAISIFAAIGSVSATCPNVPAADCVNWACEGAISWCTCYNANDEVAYTAAGCNGDGVDCACSEPAATMCLTVADPQGPYLGECGLGHNSLPCPTATVPSSWCSNPAYPDRATTVAWCTETFCNTCGYNFAPVYGGCTEGVQAATPVCGECGHKSNGPCLHGELANNAKCRPRWNNEPRLSLKNDVGCMANHCTDCGNLNGKPCNNGDGEPICDAGLAPRKYATPENPHPNCVAIAPGCPPDAATWTEANDADWSGTGLCATLPKVGDVYYNRVPGTFMTPDIDNPFVHGPAFVL